MRNVGQDIYQEKIHSQIPAIQALNKAVGLIGDQGKFIKNISGDSRFADLPGRLKAASDELTFIMDTILKANAYDKASAKNGGAPELVALCAQREFAIAKEINRKTNQFGSEKTRYEGRLNELRGSYTQEQIDRIIGETEKPDENAHNSECRALSMESLALTRYMRDYPRYDRGLLKGTSLENWKPDNADAFDAAAEALAR